LHASISSPYVHVGISQRDKKIYLVALNSAATYGLQRMDVDGSNLEQLDTPWNGNGIGYNIELSAGYEHLGSGTIL
jgi:hypothetical protein